MNRASTPMLALLAVFSALPGPARSASSGSASSGSASSGSASSGSASFNCARASSADERAVCADKRLSALDGVLGGAYAAAVRSAGDDGGWVRKTARDFLADRRACGSDPSCLLASYVAVLRQFSVSETASYVPADVSADTIANGHARPSGVLPDRVGACAITRVDAVHPRLGEEGDTFSDADFDSGTGIEFRNGGYQVSYNREAALIGSRPGDEAVMCLVAVPHDCPPGDNRGRMYTVTNKRTGDTWTLPDSQHMCGGA